MRHMRNLAFRASRLSLFSAVAQDDSAVIDDIDIYRAAKLLIDKHGEKAGIEASMRADALLERGDLDGHVVWLRILKAVEELQNTKPTGPVH